jgi:hypothetical protein
LKVIIALRRAEFPTGLWRRMVRNKAEIADLMVKSHEWALTAVPFVAEVTHGR